MAAGDLVQKGTSVVVGYNGMTYGTLFQVEGNASPMADIEEIKGPQGATLTFLITNPRKEYKVSGICLSADQTAVEAMKIGDAVSIDSVSCILTGLDLSYSAGAMKATITAVKYDAVTHS
jgi:hypothetical protein